MNIFFFFNDTATTEIYTLSLHDALPVLPPSAPRYRDSRRFSFWIWKPRGSSGGCAGICARSVVAYRRKSSRAKHARAMSARSYALVYWPGPSSPLGVTVWVSYAPISRANAFIASMVPATPAGPPPTRASTVAASLPELSSRPSQRVSIEYLPPTSNPTAELPRSKSRSAGTTSTTWAGSSLGSRVAASNSFWTLAGARYSCGPHPPRTAPLSRSATSHAVADRLLGGGGAPAGSVRPGVPRASPPMTSRVGSCVGGVAVGTGWAVGTPEAIGHGPLDGRAGGCGVGVGAKAMLAAAAARTCRTIARVTVQEGSRVPAYTLASVVSRK